MNVLLHPTYFPSVSHYVAMLQANSVTFETEDNFQKQTNRNRMYIYGPNGLQLLNIPVKHNPTSQKYKDVKIDNDANWQKNHFKSLETAYRMSPFYEFLIDEFESVFFNQHTYLMDLNFQIMEIINSCLNLKLEYQKTTEYFHESFENVDFRHLSNGKKDTCTNTNYTQVFDNKHGFLPNLSVLDLLFNEGKLAKEYLLKQIISP